MFFPFQTDGVIHKLCALRCRRQPHFYRTKMIQHPTCLLTRELLRSCAVLSLRNSPEGQEPNFNSFIEMDNFRRLSRIGVRPSDGEAEAPPLILRVGRARTYGWE